MGKNKEYDIQVQCEELEQVIKALKGLAAIAEQYSEGCDTEMLCLYYRLETQIPILENLLKDDAPDMLGAKK